MADERCRRCGGSTVEWDGARTCVLGHDCPGSKPATTTASQQPKTKTTRQKKPKAAASSKRRDHVRDAAEVRAHLEELGQPVSYVEDVGWHSFADHRWQRDLGSRRVLNKIKAWSNDGKGRPRQSRSIRSVADILSWDTLTTADQWDANNNLVSFSDGWIIDFEEKPQLVRGPQYRITRRLGCSLPQDDPAFSGGQLFPNLLKQSTLWSNKCAEWMPNKEVRTYVQTLLGAAFLGRIPREEQLVLYLQSAGGFGKSVFLSTLDAAFGSLGITVGAEVIMSGKQDHLTELAQLQGRRLVSVLEVPKRSCWDSARVKNLSGGERISARFMRQNHFRFSPTFLIVASGNFDPRLRGGEAEGMMRRLRVLRWPVKGFTRPDPHLTDKLHSRLSDVVGWLTVGAIRYLEAGLPEVPRSMRADSQQYFESEDWTISFRRTLDFGQTRDHRVHLSKLYSHYQRWADREGISDKFQQTKRNFSKEVKTWPGVTYGGRKIEGKYAKGFSGLRIATGGLKVVTDDHGPQDDDERSALRSAIEGWADKQDCPRD